MLVVKNLPAHAWDLRVVGLIPGSGRSFGEGNGNPPQYPCLGNPVDRRAWQVTLGNAGDLGLTHGLGRSPGGGNGSSLPCLENSMDRGACWATVHGAAKSQTWLKWLSTCNISRCFRLRWGKVFTLLQYFFGSTLDSWTRWTFVLNHSLPSVHYVLNFDSEGSIQGKWDFNLKLEHKNLDYEQSNLC